MFEKLAFNLKNKQTKTSQNPPTFSCNIYKNIQGWIFQYPEKKPISKTQMSMGAKNAVEISWLAVNSKWALTLKHAFLILLFIFNILLYRVCILLKVWFDN